MDNDNILDLIEEYIRAGDELVNRANADESDQLHELAIQNYAKALQLDPQSYTALYHWGASLIRQAYYKGEDEGERLLELAWNKLNEALKVCADDSETIGKIYIEQGHVLYSLAEIESIDTAEGLFIKSCEKFEDAYLLLGYSNYDLFNQWGLALSGLARIKNTRDNTISLFKQACHKFEVAVEIDSDPDIAYINWGNALTAIAEQKTGDEVDRLCKEAYSKYSDAVIRDPNCATTQFCWAYTLAYQATTKQGENADFLFVQAYRLFEAAIKLDPYYYDALHNWGVALLNQAEMKSGEQQQKLCEQAIRKLEDATAMGGTLSPLLLAMTYGEQGDELHCRKWLMMCYEDELIDESDKIILENSLSFQSMKNQPWFQELLSWLEQI